MKIKILGKPHGSNVIVGKVYEVYDDNEYGIITIIDEKGQEHTLLIGCGEFEIVEE